MNTGNLTTDVLLAHQAKIYLDAGLCVLPAVAKYKQPLAARWKPYQSRLPTEQEIARWFAGGADALCVIAGAISGNLEMLDFDYRGELFEPWLESVPKELFERLVVESSQSGGWHVIYRCEEPVCGSMKLARGIRDGKNETLIETRGEGGVFLCWPSPGYELIQGDLANPPVLTWQERELLLKPAWQLNEIPMPVVTAPSSLPADQLRPGDDFNQRGDVREILKRHGWTLVRQGENEYWRRPGKESGWSATLKDRVFYVHSSNADPFDAGKGYSPLAVYALLEHGGDFHAAASQLAKEGFGGDSAPGVDLSKFLPSPPATPEDPMQPDALSVDQLVDNYPVLREPVIHGLLRKGETMNVIAPPKTGKSWLVLDLAISVATGRPWLDAFDTEPGKVLIIDNELHRETCAHRIPKVAQARGVGIAELAGRMFVDNLRGRLKDIFSLKPYFESIEPGQYRIIVLDAFYRFMPLGCDENDNATMANIYNALDGYAQRLDCSFVLIHHSTKGNQSGKSVTDVGAGAGSQSRATDTHLVLRAHEKPGVVVLDAAVRSWPPIDPVCLHWEFPVWNPDKSLDPALLRSDRPRKRKETTVKPPEPEWTVERFVEEFLDGRPKTRAEIREQAADAPGLSWRRVADFLEIGESRGLIQRRQLPGRGGPKGFVRSERGEI